MSNSGSRPSPPASAIPPGARVSSPAFSPNVAQVPNADDAPRVPLPPHTPKGWYKRGFLPHCDVGQLYQTITYRLADALPIAVAKRLNSELDLANADASYRQRIEAYLDAGHGECLLRRPEFAQLVLDSWGHFDTHHYDVCAWVIMPNHMHILIRTPDRSLAETVKGWKSFTLRQINALLDRKVSGGCSAVPCSSVSITCTKQGWAMAAPVWSVEKRTRCW